MRSALVVLLLLTSFAMSGCTSWSWRLDQPPKQTILVTERVELPTVFFQGMPYVELKVNGRGPYRFLVDTGAMITSISPQVAREAHVLVTPMKVTITGATGSSEEESIVVLDRLEAPLFSLRGIQVSVFSPETARQMAWDENQIGGVIGMATLKEVLLEIDYPLHKISVARLDSATPALERGQPFDGTGPNATVRPQVKIATPSAKHPQILVLIDTGSEFGFEFSDITAFPVVGGLSKIEVFHHGVGGSIRPLFGLLNGDVRLGQATWRNPQIFSSNKSNRIGSEALAPWKLVIDPRRRLLWLVGDEAITTTTYEGRRDPDGRPSVYGFGFMQEGNCFIVQEVDPGSRAERAGLKVGDRYTWELADSGKPVEGAGTDPTRMRLHIVRGDEKLEIVLSLLDQLPAKTTKDAGATVAPADSKRD